MKRLARILLNAATALSLLLCAATITLSFVGRRPFVLGRSAVTPGIDPEAPGTADARAGEDPWSSTVTGGPRRFHESVSAVVIAGGSLTLVGQVISYVGPVLPAPGYLSTRSEYDDRERGALARSDGHWRSRGYEDLLDNPVPTTWPYEVRTLGPGARSTPARHSAPLLPYRARDDAGYFFMSPDEQREHRWFPNFAGHPKTWRVRQRAFGLTFYAIAFSILPLLRLAAFARRRLYQFRQRRAGRCRNCGYDLRATPERCPECGVIPRGDAQKPD